jgi:Protein of unknown function (DUF4038)/Domain of unknown function (DUF5060)
MSCTLRVCMQKRIALLAGVLLLLVIVSGVSGCHGGRGTRFERMAEMSFDSKKSYGDPFNEVDVDVVFARDGASWRVPTFWAGGNRWTVRFAPPEPGEYTFHLESTDKENSDLNGQDGKVTITAYTGKNALLQHGMIRVSANKRYFEQADGTPFYWLGDTWWNGLSTRLSWDGFQKMAADRQSKGFTVVQIVSGMGPLNEEVAPVDAGYQNEGGPAWDLEVKRINPKYYDYADRRIQQLIDQGMAPAIVGAWTQAMDFMGEEKLKKHWRYVIARYGAYPVFWVVGGELFDPPEAIARKHPERFTPERMKNLGKWTNVARYVHATDPYHHPVTVHDGGGPTGEPLLQDESLIDFDMFQPGHSSWQSIAFEVEDLNLSRSRTYTTKPEVVGEIGYEGLGESQLEDFQRDAFWTGELNGAAGFTYGSGPAFEQNSIDKPLHRIQYSLLTWEEGMNQPGSYQDGIGSKLVRQYDWWRFEPHPEWVTPRGTTLLEPVNDITKVDWGLGDLFETWGSDEFAQPPNYQKYPAGAWRAHGGNSFLPYAAGIPGEVRIIYAPCFGLGCATPPTVLNLEPSVRYHAYYWLPTIGVKFDLGAVERPAPGEIIHEDKFAADAGTNWTSYGSKPTRAGGRLSASGDTVTVLNGPSEQNSVAAVDARGNSSAGLVLRFHDADNYLAAVYSAKDKTIYLLDRQKGKDGKPLYSTPVPGLGADVHLTAEVRDHWAALSVGDGTHTFNTGVVHVTNSTAGRAGLLHKSDGTTQSFGGFELRKSPTVVTDDHLEKKLYDARGVYRGEMIGDPMPGDDDLMSGGWSNYAKEKLLLLDAYRPPRLPMGGDWVLVLEKPKS